MSANNQLNCKVFIGSIPPGVTEDQILAESRNHGTVENHYFCHETTNGKGWAFITYSNHIDADNAIKNMNGKLIFANTMNAVEARFANVSKTRAPAPQAPTHTVRLPPGWTVYHDPNGKPYYHNEVLNKTQWETPVAEDLISNNNTANPANNRSLFGPVGANLFIFHIPNEWTDQDLFTHFTPFGTILSARIQKDPSGRNKGFGFVSYTEGRCAMSAIAAMDGKQVCGKWLKVQHKKGEGHTGGNNHNNHNTGGNSGHGSQQMQQQQQPQMNHMMAPHHHMQQQSQQHQAAAVQMTRNGSHPPMANPVMSAASYGQQFMPHHGFGHPAMGFYPPGPTGAQFAPQGFYPGPHGLMAANIQPQQQQPPQQQPQQGAVMSSGDHQDGEQA